MRRYETTYILRPNLGDEQFSEIIERTNNIITGDGGTIINLERWGNKKLAYEIRKENLGQYIYLDYAAPGSTIQEMERIFRIDDRVLRFLTVKLADAIDPDTITSETERVAAEAAEKESNEVADSAPSENQGETEAADSAPSENQGEAEAADSAPSENQGETEPAEHENAEKSEEADAATPDTEDEE